MSPESACESSDRLSGEYPYLLCHLATDNTASNCTVWVTLNLETVDFNNIFMDRIAYSGPA